MLLAIDIGNTRIKAAVFEGNSISGLFAFDPELLPTELSAILEKFPAVTEMVVSSVGFEPDLVLPSAIPVHQVSRSWPMPFKNLYETPQTLGIDRMILASGAVLAYPKMNRLVIDAGTCITYDFIDKDDNYIGGAISPGIKLRYKALHDYTAKLPLLDNIATEGYIGMSTEKSIHSGVVNGAVYEIEGFIQRYSESYPNFIIILTGGDGDFLAERLKNNIFANSNFLLESLNQTYQYKIKHD